MKMPRMLQRWWRRKPRKHPVVVVRMSRSVLKDLFSAGVKPSYEVTAGALPTDAEVVGVSMGIDCVEFVVRSDHFQSVPAGSELPYQEIIVTEKTSNA